MISVPQCDIRNCLHFLGVKWLGNSESSERVVCKAFPKGIPDSIAYGANKHDKIEAGQIGSYIYEEESNG